MSKRISHITVLSLLAALLVAGLLAAGFMWRLSQGPVSLTFLTGRVKQMMDASLSGMRAEIGDVIIERDSESGAPRFRLRDIRVSDLTGNIIAKAPRAAVDVAGWALLSGRLEPVAFELIGPRITVRRQLDGTIQLGFAASPENGSPEAGGAVGSVAGKQDRSGAALPAPPSGSIEENPAPAFATRSIIDYLNRELLSDQGRSTAISSLKSLRVSEASISLYDEANDAWWHAPKANLVFRRVPYGFAVFADASIASGGDPWRTEFVASYKAEARAFTVTARIFDLVPADLADDVFALSKLAQVRLPLSGHAEIEFSDQGISKASAELSAAAGRVGFPDYISEPVLIDEGLLRLEYEPASEAVVIGESAIFIGGTPTQLEGRIEPVRSAEGKLTAVRFDLRTKTVTIGGAAQAAKPLALDRVEVRGVAALNEARFDLDDLIVMSGSSGLRARGRFVGSDGGVGVFVDGMARDLPAGLVKKLWPPIVAAGAREWIFDNVIDAKIPDATFRVAIPSETVAAALQGQNIPDDMVDLSFTLTDVATRYFEDLPPLRGALGTGRLTGDNFRLELRDGLVLLPSGNEVYFRHGVMTTTELAAKLSPTTFRVQGTAAAPALLELIDQEPLGLVREAGFDPAKVDGEAAVELTIDVPLARKIPDNSVRIAAKAQLDKAIIRDVLDGLSIEDGRLSVEVDETAVRASGPVKLNGTAANIIWTRPIGIDGPVESNIAVEAELAPADLKRLGEEVAEIIRGPVKVKATAKESGGRISTAHVAADLTGAELHLESLGWRRPAGGKSVAEFALEFPTSGGFAMTNLAVTGGELKIAGDLKFNGKGELLSAAFPILKLDERNDLSVKLQPQGGGLNISVAGRSFDAQPLLRKMFSPSAGAERGDGKPLSIDVAIDRIHANRGEIISKLSGTLQLMGGAVAAADLSGGFVNGEPITLKVVPEASGERELSLASLDGGATLRAVDLYSKIAGGTFDLRATLAPASKGGIRRGLLVIRNFKVHNEAVISDIDQRTAGSGRASNGPRRDGQAFSKLSLPFSIDSNYIRIGDALVRGPDIGASAQGHIRKADGSMNIGGTIIPAYALNAALGDVPVLGQLLTGGKGEGVFGLNYALKGTVNEPKFLINPVSAIAPGILRRLFDIGGVADPDGAPPPQRPQRELNR